MRTYLVQALVALSFLLGLFIFIQTDASAATILVDDISCTLEDAVDAANSDLPSGGCSSGSGVDVIYIEPSLTTIALDSGVLQVESELYLVGNDVVVDAQNMSRVIEVASSSGSVHMYELTLTNGRLNDSYGAGIYIGRGVTAFLTDVNIENNTIEATYNSSIAGAGMFADKNSDIVYEGGNIVGNRVSCPVRGEGRGQGGGMFLVDSNSTLSGLTFENNHVYGYCGNGSGGALALHGGVTNNYANIFKDNTAVFAGGAIYNNGTAYIHDSSIEHNYAVYYGGGIYVEEGEGRTNILHTYGTTVVENWSGGEGGGIYSMVKSYTYIKNGKVHANESLNSGGAGIYTEGRVLVDDSWIYDNTAPSGWMYSRGAGIFVGNENPSNYYEAPYVEIVNSRIFRNRANQGGGIFISEGYASIRNSSIYENEAVKGGGLMLEYKPTFPDGEDYKLTLVDSSTFHSNNGTQVGGVLNLYSDMFIRNSTFYENGNSIYNGKGSTRIVFSTIASDSGTGLHSDISSIRLGLGIFLVSSIVDQPINCTGSASPISEGYNVVSDNSCNLSSAGDLEGVDPYLGSLANNGGPTLTVAIPDFSPAYNHVDPSTHCFYYLTDQRGVARPLHGACDAGAFEMDDPIM